MWKRRCWILLIIDKIKYSIHSSCIITFILASQNALNNVSQAAAIDLTNSFDSNKVFVIFDASSIQIKAEYEEDDDEVLKNITDSKAKFRIH